MNVSPFGDIYLVSAGSWALPLTNYFLFYQKLFPYFLIDFHFYDTAWGVFLVSTFTG